VGSIQGRTNQIYLEPLNFFVQSDLAIGCRRRASQRFQFVQERERDFSQRVEAAVQHDLALLR
jgi:hypothetical protein